MTDPNGLSPREVQIVRMMARGMTGAQMAVRLGISPQTIKNHITAVYRKMAMTGEKRIQVVRIAFRSGTADLEESYRDMRIRQRSRRAIQLMRRGENDDHR